MSKALDTEIATMKNRKAIHPFETDRNSEVVFQLRTLLNI